MDDVMLWNSDFNVNNWNNEDSELCADMNIYKIFQELKK